jgi:hypothetical protein
MYFFILELGIILSQRNTMTVIMAILFKKHFPLLAFISLAPAVMDFGSASIFFEAVVSLFSIYSLILFIVSLSTKRSYVVPAGMLKIRKFQLMFAQSFIFFTAFLFVGFSLNNLMIIFGASALLIDWSRPIIFYISKYRSVN